MGLNCRWEMPIQSRSVRLDTCLTSYRANRKERMNPRERAVVARLATGLVIRGLVLDFTPERPAFRVTPDGTGRGVEVKLRDLKALFFTKIPGQPANKRSSHYPSVDPVTGGKRLAVCFKDGEKMTGYALSYRPEKIGFFLFPDDPDSQHEKIFVLNHEAEEVLPIGPDVSPVIRIRQAQGDIDKAA